MGYGGRRVWWRWREKFKLRKLTLMGYDLKYGQDLRNCQMTFSRTIEIQGNWYGDSGNGLWHLGDH